MRPLDRSGDVVRSPVDADTDTVRVRVYLNRAVDPTALALSKSPWFSGSTPGAPAADSSRFAVRGGSLWTAFEQRSCRVSSFFFLSFRRSSFFLSVLGVGVLCVGLM